MQINIKEQQELRGRSRLRSILLITGIVLSSFFVSLLAGRFRSQRGLVALTMLLCLTAYAGFLSGANELIPLWCVLLGLGQGACLSLALMFFILRTSDARSAAELSGMAQSVGYFLAALGPILFGGLHDLTHGWTIPLVVLIIVTLILLSMGLSAGRDVMVVVGGHGPGHAPARVHPPQP